MIPLFEDNNGIIVRGDDPDWIAAGTYVAITRKESLSGEMTTRYAEVERRPRNGFRDWGDQLAAPYNGAWDYMLRWCPPQAMRTPELTIILGQATHYCMEAR